MISMVVVLPAPLGPSRPKQMPSGTLKETHIGFSVHSRGTNNEEARKNILDALRATFRPEFLNRIDDIIVFNTLSRENLEKIIQIQLKKVVALLAERGLKLELTRAAEDLLMAEGYDPQFGARPLKRAIQREIETPLARRILGGEVRDGHHVTVDLDPAGHLVFESKLESREREAALKEA